MISLKNSTRPNSTHQGLPSNKSNITPFVKNAYPFCFKISKWSLKCLSLPQVLSNGLENYDVFPHTVSNIPAQWYGKSPVDLILLMVNHNLPDLNALDSTFRFANNQTHFQLETKKKKKKNHFFFFFFFIEI